MKTARRAGNNFPLQCAARAASCVNSVIWLVIPPVRSMKLTRLACRDAERQDRLVRCLEPRLGLSRRLALELIRRAGCRDRAFVREKGDSAYHPSCTSKMGTDEMAVVGPQARGHGFRDCGLVDASTPSIVSGNLNAPTIMMAEGVQTTSSYRKPFTTR